jgi:hypothetical protein
MLSLIIAGEFGMLSATTSHTFANCQTFLLFMTLPLCHIGVLFRLPGIEDTGQLANKNKGLNTPSKSAQPSKERVIAV